MHYLAYGPGYRIDPALCADYVNDENALRFMHRHLTKRNFPAGQYDVYNSTTKNLIGTIYKRA